MSLHPIDLVAFCTFIAVVVVVSVLAARRQQGDRDYFLAGRALPWWMIGFSLIASNISTEHFVGMAGRGYDLGLAIASYEWMAAVTLVVVALFFLPKFLAAGIYTIPEFLEYRYEGIWEGFGALMFASHESLRDRFEVSHPALDRLVEVTRSVDGVLGSRLCGAGFGGCTLTLCAAASLDAFAAEIERTLSALGTYGSIMVLGPAVEAGVVLGGS